MNLDLDERRSFGLYKGDNGKGSDGVYLLNVAI